MSSSAPLLWLDGTVVPTVEATLPLMAHAAQRGSLVFDVGSWHVAAAGRRSLFRVADHVARFTDSARIVGLEVPFDAATLVRAAVEVVKANAPERDGLVRWSIFFAADEPDLLPRHNRAHVAVAAQLLDGPVNSSSTIRVATFTDARKAAPDTLPPTVKAAAAYLGPMLARRRAIAAGADDVVLLDVNGDIAEGPIANAFAVMEGRLWTPPLGHILPGITRRSVLEIAGNLGIELREERLSRDAFQHADEAFLTGTSLPISPISAIDGRSLDAPGPITTRLLAVLRAARDGTSSAYARWLTQVG